MPPTAVGKITPVPEFVVVTIFIEVVRAVALPCTVPAAVIPVVTPLIKYALVVTFALVILPVTASELSVPTDVIFGCAFVVTVPAVDAAPVNAPTNVVDVTLDNPATVVTVLPNVNVVLPNVTDELANLAWANVPDEILLASNAVRLLPLPLNIPEFAVMLTPVIVPFTPKPVNVPVLVILGCAFVVTVPAVATLKLATCVVLDTTNGAVPVDIF
jgi:hypothetical protein